MQTSVTLRTAKPFRKQTSCQMENKIRSVLGTVSALFIRLMKPKSVLFTLVGCAVVFAAAMLPRESSGQAGNSDEALVQQALAEAIAQQKLLTENQAKIDDKIGLIAEEIRIARIYAGRTGGKTK